MTESTFADQAYDHILGQIIRCELRPGDLLDRKLVAEKLDISLIPVSDAVQRLAYEGLLTTRRRQGTFVSSPSIEDVRGHLLLREALECQSARLYCGEKIKAAYQSILPLAESIDQTAAAGEPFFFKEFEFHQALVSLTECKALIQCFQRVVNLSLFHEVSVIRPMRPVTFEKHVDLIDDLCNASSDQAEARIRKHIRAGKAGLLE